MLRQAGLVQRPTRSVLAYSTPISIISPAIGFVVYLGRDQRALLEVLLHHENRAPDLFIKPYLRLRHQQSPHHTPHMETVRPLLAQRPRILIGRALVRVGCHTLIALRADEHQSSSPCFA